MSKIIKNSSSLTFVFMIITICSFINEFSLISILFFSVGFAMIVTIIELSVEGEIKMKKITRRMLSGIGVVLSTIALLEEVRTISLIMFFIGLLGIVMIFNIEIEKKYKND